MSESTVSMGQSARAREDAASLEARLFSSRPNGPAVAALLAGAIGVFVLGLNTFLSAAAEGVAEWFRFQNRVGPLSGKTTMAGVVWLVVWAVLAAALWRRNVRVEWVWAAVIVLLVVGNLLMFPPIYERFEPG